MNFKIKLSKKFCFNTTFLGHAVIISIFGASINQELICDDLLNPFMFDQIAFQSQFTHIWGANHRIQILPWNLIVNSVKAVKIGFGTQLDFLSWKLYKVWCLARIRIFFDRDFVMLVRDPIHIKILRKLCFIKRVTLFIKATFDDDVRKYFGILKW